MECAGGALRGSGLDSWERVGSIEMPPRADGLEEGLSWSTFSASKPAIGHCTLHTFASRLGASESGGIGRRTRLRIWRVKP
jgi:hypothetical protein